MQSHYRIAIFGSARIKEGDREYEDVRAIARGLAAHGYDIVTGGGPGLMQAANAGSRSVDTESLSIGLNIRLPHEQVPNPYLDIKREYDRFGARLDTFMALSDAVVVAPGGIGTLLELFYTWQLVQVGHVCRTPIILFGEVWRPLLHWINGQVVARGYVDAADLQGVFLVEDGPQQVVDLVRSIERDRARNGAGCVNFEKYRVDGSSFDEGPGSPA
jgi:uncharacterized protein (TIGR00730 family)